MNRVNRSIGPIFSGLASVSMLFCIATVFLWARSFGTLDVVRRDHHWRMELSDRLDAGWRDVSIWSSRGVVKARMVRAYRRGYEGVALGPRWSLGHNDQGLNDPGEAAAWRQILPSVKRIHYQLVEGGSWNLWWTVRIPYWVPAAVFASLPATAVWRWRRRREPHAFLIATNS